MKHPLPITAILLVLFLVAHLVGLFVLSNYQTHAYPYGIEPPVVETQASAAQLIISLIVITVLALVVIKMKARRFWKFWFLLSLVVTMLLSFSSFMPALAALIVALALALWRVYKNNVFIHNFTEMFVYGGLASIFVPVLNVLSIVILLVVISVYDYISVFRTKHMIAMAKFQTDNKMFAGLLVPYDKKTAILGGGDIGFTLMFSGVMFYQFGLFKAILSSLIIGISLLTLFLLTKKNKFYPAMPFLSAGCFVALGIIALLP